MKNIYGIKHDGTYFTNQTTEVKAYTNSSSNARVNWQGYGDNTTPTLNAGFLHRSPWGGYTAIDSYPYLIVSYSWFSTNKILFRLY